MLTKAEINLIRSLDNKKERYANGLFVVEGRKMVGEALDSGFDVKAVYGTEGYADIPGCIQVGEKDMSRISRLKSPQGILALVGLPDYHGAVPEGLVLVLDCIQDPGNLGTIVRTADWFGIRDIVCSHDTADLFNPKVVQASMGAVFRVRVHYCELASYLAAYTRAGGDVLGAFLEGENLYEASIPQPGECVVVLGNEGNGISEEIGTFVTRKIFIPPFPANRSGSESLNVSTAGAVICSELRRRCQGISAKR